MSVRFATPVNVPSYASDPAIPTSRAGDTYRNSSSGKFRSFDGVQWVDSVPAGTGGGGTGDCEGGVCIKEGVVSIEARAIYAEFNAELIDDLDLAFTVPDTVEAAIDAAFLDVLADYAEAIEQQSDVLAPLGIVLPEVNAALTEELSLALAAADDIAAQAEVLSAEVQLPAEVVAVQSEAITAEIDMDLEGIAAQSEAISLGLSASDDVAGASEALSAEIVLGAETVPALSDALGALAVVVPETNAEPIDALTALDLTLATEPILAQSDQLEIALSIPDEITILTGTQGAGIQAGATTVTQTTGTGWTNPANAQGLSNGVNATINSAANALGATTVTGTLTGTFASLGTLANEELVIFEDGLPSGVYRLDYYFTLALGALGTVSLALQYSSNSGTNYTTSVTHTASISPAGGVQSFSVPGLAEMPKGSIGNLRFRVVASIKGGNLAPSTATLDAVELRLVTTSPNPAL